MRKTIFIPLLLVAVLALAACGGGGSSSSGSTGAAGGISGGSGDESSAASPEAAWAKEVTDVMTEFENTVTPTVIEPIHTSTSQQHLEPLYSSYSIDLTVLSRKLAATEAPAACVAVRKKMAGYTSQVAALTKTLSSDAKLNPEQYAAKSYRQGLKIDKLGHKLGALTAKPSC